MIDLVSEPLTTRALSLTDILRFELDANGASVDVDPFFSVLNFAIDGTTGGGAADGQDITLFNSIFTTDSAEDYTATTWDHSGTPEEAANNFANMLRANFLFKDYNITVGYSAGGDVWAITATATEAKTFDDFVFDQSGFSPAFVEFVSINGNAASLNNFRIYYDIFEGADTSTINKLGNTRVAFVPYNSISGEQNAIIDLADQLSNIFALHNFLIDGSTRVREEAGLKREFHLKYGGLNFDSSCNPSYVAGGQTSSFNLVYTAIQRDRLTNFQKFTIIGEPIGSVKWLSDRHATMDIPSDYYETINVYIPDSDDWQDWSLRFSFYDVDDNLLGVETNALDENKVYQVAVGTANLDGFIPNNTTYYTIELIGIELVGGLPTPPQRVFELLRRNIVERNCSKQEIYFIEDLNSYRTVRLENIALSLAGQSRTTAQPLLSDPVSGFYTAEDYANRGGISSRYSEADKVITLQTDRIRRGEKSFYDQLLRSPIHLMKETTVDGLEVIRKIVLTRANRVIFQNGEAVRLNLEFRYNEKLNLLK